MKDKVIGSVKPKGVSRSPWEHKTRKGQKCPRKGKWAKDAQKENGTKEPRSNVTKKKKAQMTIQSH